MQPSFYVALLDRRETVADVLEAALADLPVVLPLAEEPPATRSCSVELRAPGLPDCIRMMARLDERLSGHRYRMRLRPMNDEHAGELLALLSRERTHEHKLPRALRSLGAHAARQAPAIEERPTMRGRLRGSDRPPRRSERPVVHPAPQGPLVRSITESLRGPTLVGRLLSGTKYRLDAPLARTRFSRVHRGRYLALGEPVAIHLLDPAIDSVPELRRRVHLGARVLASLDHENLVRVLDCGDEDDGALFLVTELLEGESLASMLDRQAPLPLGRIVDLGAQLAAALTAVHARGLVHPLLHPECVTLVRQGALELVKLDEVALPSEAVLALPPEQRGEAYARYVAPERASRQDAASDLYALGAILQHMAVGKPPSAPSDRRDPSEPPLRAQRPGLDRTLEAIIVRATTSSPSDRYASASELRDALLQLANVAAPSPARVPRMPRVRQPSSTIVEAVVSATLEAQDGPHDPSIEPRQAMRPPPTPSLAAAPRDAGSASEVVARGYAPPDAQGDDAVARAFDALAEDAPASGPSSRAPAASASLASQRSPSAPPASTSSRPTAAPPDDYAPHTHTSARHEGPTAPVSVHAARSARKSTHPPPPHGTRKSTHPPPPRRDSRLPDAELPALTHPASGFADFFVAFTAAVSRTAYYAPDHPEHGHASGRLLSLTEAALRGRGELTFIRYDQPSESPQLSVASGLGELVELRRAIASGVGETFGARLGEMFARRKVAALTLKEGIGLAELLAITDLLSGPEVTIEEQRERFCQRDLAHVSVLWNEDLLGSTRELPWQVNLCISRMARDLSALPLLRGLDAEQRRALRLSLVADVVRALRPEQIEELLENTDLVVEAVRHVPELEALDLPFTVASGLRPAQCVRVIEHLLPALARARAPGEPPVHAADAAALPETDPRRIALAIAQRLAAEPTPAARSGLRMLHEAGALHLGDLPFAAQVELLGEQLADRLAEDTQRALDALATPDEPARYAQDLQTLARALPVLARGGLLAPLADAVAWLHDRAQGAKERDALPARQALCALDEPSVLAPIASTLIGPRRASGAERQAAHAILLSLGERGAQALCTAHEGLNAEDVRRVAFVRTLHDLGEPAVAVIAAALQKHAARGPDASPQLLEDLIRALPERPDQELGALVAGLLHHHAPGVRRAAITALVSLWGARAIPPLLVAFDEADASLRVALLVTLRRLSAIDAHVVRRIDGLLAGLEPAGAELRVAAAAALADVLPDARALAQHVLRDEIARNDAGLPSFELRTGDDRDVAALDVRNLGSSEGRARIKRAMKTAMKRDVRTLLGSAESAEAVLEATCASLLALGDPEDKKLVEARIARASSRVANRLQRLLQKGDGPA